jgi:ADP-ribose pyrophosphatase
MSRQFEGRVISVDVDELTLPNGRAVTLERVNHPGGAAIVALNENNEVCLLSQFRHVTHGRIIELPAGKLEHGDPLVTAKTELAEEAGLSASHWKSLGMIYSSPGVFTEKIYLYLATGLTTTTTAHEPAEDIEIFWQPLEAAVAQALNGTYCDAKTIIGLVRAQACVLGNAAMV